MGFAKCLIPYWGWRCIRAQWASRLLRIETTLVEPACLVDLLLLKQHRRPVTDVPCRYNRSPKLVGD